MLRRSKRSRLARRPSLQRRLLVEPLEDRRLLTTVSLSGGDGSNWTIRDDRITTNGLPTGGSCTSSADGSGATFNDASISGQVDAYDDASTVWVNNVRVGGALSQSGNTVTFGSQNIAGLNVQMEYHVLSSSATARNVTSLQNPTGSPITVTVDLLNNFGSDGATSVQGSSTGDTVFTTADRWVVTDDVSQDPANTSVLYGPNSPVSTPTSVSQTVFDCAGDQGVRATFSVTVPAGQTRSLMFFHTLHDTSANAIANAATFDANPGSGSDLLAGLSPTEQAQIVNWNLGGSVGGGGGLGRLYTYDANGSVIREVDATSGAVLNSFGSPLGPAVGPDFGMATSNTSLIIGGPAGQPILELHPTSGAVLRTIVPGSSQPRQISGMAFLNDEIFALTDSPSGEIRVYDFTSGALDRVLNTGNAVEGLTASSSSLYATAGSNNLVEINPANGAVTNLGTPPGVVTFMEGLGIIGNELFIAQDTSVRVHDLGTLNFLRTLSGQGVELEAIGADAGSFTGGGTNDPPVADAGGPYTITEGQPLTLDASGSSDPDGDPLTFRWDVDGDGDYDENVTGVNPTLTWPQLVALGINDGFSTHSITVEASDGVGGGPGTFEINTLTTNNANIFTNHAGTTGDDRGGIAASPTHVFYTGDSATGRFDINALNPTGSLPRNDGIVSNLRDQQLYALGVNPTTPISGSSGPQTITHLIELDNNGNPTGSNIPLSSGIPVNTSFGEDGIFAGYDRIMLFQNDGGTVGDVFRIDLPTGNVSNLGSVTLPHTFTENWAFWGVTENFGGDEYLTYISGNSAVRTRISDNVTSTIVAFPGSVADMGTITVSIPDSRWYFHYEGFASAFGTGADENIGYADATFSVGGGGGGGTDTDTATLTLTNADPTIDSFSVPGTATTGSPVNLNATASDPAGAADPLNFTWTITRPDSTSFSLVGPSPSFTPNQDGVYGVDLLVDDGDGGTDSASAAITVAGTQIDIVAGNLVIRDVQPGGKDDTLTVAFDGGSGEFVVSDPNNFIATTAGSGNFSHEVRIPAGSFGGSIIVDALGGDDLLTVETGGLGRDVQYDGGSQNNVPNGDTLVLTNGSFFNTTYNYDNANDGDINLDGQIITYTGLEPITAFISATNITLNYSGASETITVSDGGGGQTTVNSTAGEITTFNNPSNSLTMNAGGGNDGVDVNGFGAGFNASLTIDGQSGIDETNWQTTNSLADLTATSETINLNSGSVTTSGDQTYNGTVFLGSDTSLFVNDVSFNGTLDSNGGPDSLNVNTSGGGTTNFGGPVGSIAPLLDLQTNPDGVTLVQGGSVFTVGDQTYFNPVSITNHTLFAGDDALIAGGLDGAWALILQMTGSVAVTGPIGAAFPPTSLAVNAVDLTVAAAVNVNGPIGASLSSVMTVSGSGSVSSNGNPINILASDMLLGGPISAGASSVDLFSSNATRTFALGSGPAVKSSGLDTGSAAFSLDDAELDLITAASRTVWGDSSNDQFNVNYTGSDTQPLNVRAMGGNDDVYIAPSATMPLDLLGGDPTTQPGDTLHLDMSGALPPVVIDTIGGFALSGSTAVVSFGQFESLELCDDSGDIDNADIGDLYVRTRGTSERIVFTNWSDGGVRLRIDDLENRADSITYLQHFGLLGGVQSLEQILVYAQDGNDSVIISSRVVDGNGDAIPAEFHGEDGNDYLLGAQADDLLVGGPGRDRLIGNDGNNVMFGDGNVFVGATLQELPTDDNDTLTGRNGDDILWGGGGNDMLSGGSGNDVLNGGSGDDRLDGGLGDDLLRGMDGDDTLSGHSGNDFLLGGIGADRLFGRSGNDILIAGEGADFLSGETGNDLLVSGTTANDGDSDAALLAILAAWNGNPTPDTLASPLSGITGDTDRDDISGSSGDDEFWATLADDLVRDGSRDAGDVVNDN